MDTVSSFRALHAGDRILVLPNAWDAASAALIRSAGASAIATTSAGLAWACGYADGNVLPRESLLFAVRAICRVGGGVPVSVDLEEGYSSDPGAVAELVCLLREAGAAGINIEDGEGDPAVLAAKIVAIKGACDIFVNARTDVFLRELAHGEAAVTESIARGKRYAQAGADGFFVPGIAQQDSIRTIVRSVELPLNVLAVPDLAPQAELYQTGVRRLSAGILISKLALGTARRAAAAFLQGNLSDAVFAQAGVDYAEMNTLLTSTS